MVSARRFEPSYRLFRRLRDGTDSASGPAGTWTDSGLSTQAAAAVLWALPPPGREDLLSKNGGCQPQFHDVL